MDNLHIVNLGVMQAFLKVAAWALLDGSQWGVGAMNEEEHIRIAVLQMRSELRHFYRQHKADHPSETLTHANDLTLKMLGSRLHPKIKLSGAETWGFLLFVASALRTHKDAVGPRAATLQEAADRLIRIQRLSRQGAGSVPPGVQQAYTQGMQLTFRPLSAAHGH